MYEGHITLEPVHGSALHRAIELAYRAGFKASEEPGYLGSSYSERTTRNDGFLTGHSPEYVLIRRSMKQLILDLQAEGFQVRRYKIEHIVVDSKLYDEWELIERKSIGALLV